MLSPERMIALGLGLFFSSPGALAWEPMTTAHLRTEAAYDKAGERAVDCGLTREQLVPEAYDDGTLTGRFALVAFGPEGAVLWAKLYSREEVNARGFCNSAVTELPTGPQEPDGTYAGWPIS